MPKGNHNLSSKGGGGGNHLKCSRFARKARSSSSMSTKEQFYIAPQQKPSDQFPKKKIESSKIPISLRFDILPKMREKMHET